MRDDKNLATFLWDRDTGWHSLVWGLNKTHLLFLTFSSPENQLAQRDQPQFDQTNDTNGTATLLPENPLVPIKDWTYFGSRLTLFKGVYGPKICCILCFMTCTYLFAKSASFGTVVVVVAAAALLLLCWNRNRNKHALIFLLTSLFFWGFRITCQCFRCKPKVILHRRTDVTQAKIFHFPFAILPNKCRIE